MTRLCCGSRCRPSAPDGRSPPGCRSCARCSPEVCLSRAPWTGAGGCKGDATRCRSGRWSRWRSTSRIPLIAASRSHPATNDQVRVVRHGSLLWFFRVRREGRAMSFPLALVAQARRDGPSAQRAFEQRGVAMEVTEQQEKHSFRACQRSLPQEAPPTMLPLMHHNAHVHPHPFSSLDPNQYPPPPTARTKTVVRITAEEAIHLDECLRLSAASWPWTL